MKRFQSHPLRLGEKTEVCHCFSSFTFFLSSKCSSNFFSLYFCSLTTQSLATLFTFRSKRTLQMLAWKFKYRSLLHSKPSYFLVEMLQNIHNQVHKWKRTKFHIGGKGECVGICAVAGLLTGWAVMIRYCLSFHWQSWAVTVWVPVLQHGLWHHSDCLSGIRFYVGVSAYSCMLFVVVNATSLNILLFPECSSYQRTHVAMAHQLLYCGSCTTLLLHGAYQPRQRLPGPFVREAHTGSLAPVAAATGWESPQAYVTHFGVLPVFGTRSEEPESSAGMNFKL